MFRSLELTIGLRYLRAKRRNHFISFISIISMLGIVLGVWALITIMSVMNGFHSDLRERILFVVSHVTVQAGSGYLDNWLPVARYTQELDDVAAMAPFVLGQGLLTNGKHVKGALIRGIYPDYEKTVSELLNHVVAGSAHELEPGSYSIVLGKRLARSLELEIGDKVNLVAPKGKVTPAGILPRMKRFTVAGLFEIDMHEYDSGIALVNIEDLQKVLGIEKAVSGVRLKLRDIDRARALRGEVQQVLGSGFRVRDWTQEHANFFRALEIEKRVVFIVMMLIVAVAAFNLVSTLVMIVTDKQSDVAILRTLGMSPGSIMRVFMVQGSTIGIIGVIVGGTIGVITALNMETLVPWLEQLFNTELFPSDVYVISDFPARLEWLDVIVVIGASLVMSFIATIYPAFRASRVQPAEALRYD
ncbi:MAG: lipoprotein-releasing ABC transporter permease subunit [Gammaproteobacteria bacterium]|nr:lipoprotein-releasing ABC transporter permease subunit [Gammaproteobacteria bacterium]